MPSGRVEGPMVIYILNVDEHDWIALQTPTNSKWNFLFPLSGTGLKWGLLSMGFIIWNSQHGNKVNQ